MLKKALPVFSFCYKLRWSYYRIFFSHWFRCVSWFYRSNKTRENIENLVSIFLLNYKNEIKIMW